MQIEVFRYDAVGLRGEVLGGAVELNGSIFISRGEGCGLAGCDCSPGVSMSVFAPVDADRALTGIRVVFDSLAEMDEVLNLTSEKCDFCDHFHEVNQTCGKCGHTG